MNGLLDLYQDVIDQALQFLNVADPGVAVHNPAEANVAAQGAKTRAKASCAIDDNLLRRAIEKLTKLFIPMDQEDQDGDGAGVGPQPSVVLVKRKMASLWGAYNYFEEKHRLVVFKLGEMTLEQTITENAYLNRLLDLLILVRLFITLPRPMLQCRKPKPEGKQNTGKVKMLSSTKPDPCGACKGFHEFSKDGNVLYKTRLSSCQV